MHKISSVLIASTFIVFALLLIGCTADVPSSKTKWTVMVYLSGDNDLEEYVVRDIETELAPTGSSGSVQVVALADRGPGYDTSDGDWQQTLLFHVTPGMAAVEENAIADWGEKNFGDPQTLIDFVTWTKANYPAEHYALYFWGHGWNWHPSYVMWDDTSADSLDYEEMKALLPSLGLIDVVGYDGCNMASIEIFNLWHGHATAVTSSQEYVGWEGLQYDRILAQLSANPDMTPDQLAFASSQSADAEKTWSAVAVDSRFDKLITSVDQWSIALKDGLTANRPQYEQAFTATQSFWETPMDKDLYDMAEEINNKVGDTDLKLKSQAVMSAINEVVLHEQHADAYDEAHGITIYHISQASEKDSDYSYYRETLDFALQTGWDEFLDAYAR